MKHIMFDAETLGTVADACILSIGAVRFDLDSDAIDDAGFYASISIDSNLEHKRRIQEDTLIWWMKQGEASQGVFHESKQTLRTALSDLTDWIGDARDVKVWSNGADFDLPMLAHAYTSLGMDVPWQFWNSCCYRTYKNLPGAKNVRIPFDGTKHNALFDAVHQAKTAQAIQAKLFTDNHVMRTKEKT
jgi:DNA polymerase III epsilon subunit-like protein